MNGQARALIESMPNELGTEAVSPLSFDEAFTLHHRAVFRTARAVVRDSALAEDVTQEYFSDFIAISTPRLVKNFYERGFCV
jgi:hypothetical protein